LRLLALAALQRKIPGVLARNDQVWLDIRNP
jgi:hypothetical protein